MLTVIHTLANDEETLVQVEGRTLAVPTIVEDDDGLRWYLSDDYATVTPQHWLRAVEQGIVGLVMPSGDGFKAVTVETYMDNREEDQGGYVWSSPYDKIFDSFPAYSGLLAPYVVRDVSEPETASGGIANLGFTHLHLHTEHSALDGRSFASEAFAEVVKHGQQAAAVTDHGTSAPHPGWQREADKAGVKAIFGIEAYLVNDRFRRPVEWWVDRETERKVSDEVFQAASVEERKKRFERKTDAQEVKNNYWHLTLLAENDTGLKNIWAASTESFRDGQYYTPKMDWDTLARHSEGVICLTGCLRGPVADLIVKGDEAGARQHLGRLMEIYGDGNVFLEVMPNDLEEQVLVNETLARYAEDFGIPLVATVDSHYSRKEQLDEHKTWVAVQTNADVQDESKMFAKDLGLYIQSEAEVRVGLKATLSDRQIDQAIDSTGIIAARCNARIPNESHLPVFSKKGGAERDAERLLEICMENWHLTKGKKDPQDAYIARFEHEFGLLVRKGFCGYFLQVADYVNWARREGCQVGPGRGSGGGSLVAWLCGITGLDPVEAQLLFERFMTEGRTSLPDFDVDFPTSWRDRVQDYITKRYGEENVVRVGTHLRQRNKGIIKDLFRALASELPEDTWRDQKAIADIITAAEASTAGIGLSWDELWAQEGEVLQPYADRYPKVFGMAEKLVKILKSYGKHAAGLVVSTDTSLIKSLPLRLGEIDSTTGEQMMITQFDMADLDAMGYIKFDILTLRTLDTIQATVDLIKANRGIEIDMDSWKDEYQDPQVWEELSAGHTLGVFQIETAGGTRLTKQVKPQNMDDLSDTLTVVRPGPARSGLKDLYLARRSGEKEVSFPDPRLEQVLAKTHGCILYQEDVMQTTMILAGYDSNKADEVRKILGKKKVELVLAAGREFVEGCVTHGMDREAAEILWEQLGEFAKYSFGRAHAYGYAVLAYWTAWLKVHYPVEFFTSVLSTVKAERIPEFVAEARRMGFSILPPDVNDSGRNFTCQGLNVRYGLEAIPGLGAASVDPILAGQPYSSFEDFVARSKADKGVQMTLVRIGAFDTLVANRRGLETLLLNDKAGISTQCTFKVPGVGTGPDGVCTFDWASEPAPVNQRTGKTLKKKDPPKRCTKACRQYTAPPPLDISTIEAYTDEDVRNIEMELLGLHLSSTAFDRLDDEERELLRSQADDLLHIGSEGNYLLGVTISKVRKHTDRNGKDMAFVGLATELGEVDAVMFSSTWEKYREDLRVGDLKIVEVTKQSGDKGTILNFVAPPPA